MTRYMCRVWPWGSRSGRNKITHPELPACRPNYVCVPAASNTRWRSDPSTPDSVSLQVAERGRPEPVGLGMDVIEHLGLVK